MQMEKIKMDKKFICRECGENEVEDQETIFVTIVYKKKWEKMNEIQL